MSGVRKYLSFARTSLEITFVYRAGYVLNLIGTIFYVAAMFYLWQTIFLTNPGSLGGFSWGEMKAYILVSFLLNSLLTWYDEWLMSQDVREGRVAIDLARPIDFQATRFATAMGPIGFEAFTATVVALIVAWIAGGVAVPADPARFGLFVLSCALATLVKFGMVYCVSMTAFWTTNIEGIMVGRIAFQQIFSGALIPLVFFPGWFQGLAAALPFPAMISTPALVYLGKFDGPTTAVMIGIQAAWAVGLIVAGRLAFRQAVKAVTIHGG